MTRSVVMGCPQEDVRGSLISDVHDLAVKGGSHSDVRMVWAMVVRMTLIALMGELRVTRKSWGTDLVVRMASHHLVHSRR